MSRLTSYLFVLSILIYGTFVSSSTLAQNINARYLSLNAAYPSDGIQLGQGWDSAIARRTNSQCLQFSSKSIDIASSRFEVSELKDTYSLLEARNLTASASGSAWGITANASYSRSTRLTLNTEYLNYFASYILQSGGEFVVATKKPFIEKKSDQTTTGERAALEAVELSNELRTMLSTFSGAPEEKLSKFVSNCGDYFVSAIHRGIRVNILATYASTNRLEQESVKAAVQANGFGAAVSVSTRRDEEHTYDTGKFRFVVDQQGLRSGLAPTVLNFQEIRTLIGSLNESDAFADPTAYLVTLTPYSVLAEWREIFAPTQFEDWQEQFAKPSLADIVVLFSAYRDLYEILDHAEREYVGGEFERYGIFPETLRVVKKYDRRAVKMIGGVKRIRENKAQLQRSLFVMEQVFGFCFVQRTCFSGDTLSGLAAFLGGAIQTLQKREDARVQQKSTNRVEGDEVERNKVEESELVARVVLLSELVGSLEEFLKNRVSEFHEVLAETPLPSEVFQPYKLGQSISDEERDIEWRKAAMRTIVSDLIYFERLDPWNQQFCKRNNAIWMCRTTNELMEVIRNSSIEITEDLVKISKAVPDKGSWIDYNLIERECDRYYAEGKMCP